MGYTKINALSLTDLFVQQIENMLSIPPIMIRTRP